MGKTYDLELHRPKEDKVPYICKLTFNAPGDDFGDIVQVSRLAPETSSHRILGDEIRLRQNAPDNLFMKQSEKRRASEIRDKLRRSESDFN